MVKWGLSLISTNFDAAGCHKNSDCYNVIKCIDARVACVGSKCTCISEILSLNH